MNTFTFYHFTVYKDLCGLIYPWPLSEALTYYEVGIKVTAQSEGGKE